MANTQYTINAFSPSLNQSIREFDLGNGNPAIQDKIYATQLANAFAQRMNKKRHMQAADWVGQPKFETLGIETLPNYLFHTGSK